MYDLSQHPQCSNPKDLNCGVVAISPALAKLRLVRLRGGLPAPVKVCAIDPPPPSHLLHQRLIPFPGGLFNYNFSQIHPRIRSELSAGCATVDFLEGGRKRDGGLPRTGGLCALPLSVVRSGEIRALFF
jgi:hypothetical protein